MSKSKYPECDRWSVVHSNAVIILNFLEWKDNRQAKEMFISHEDLVYEFFDIDPKKLELERRAMLDSLQNTD